MKRASGFMLMEVMLAVLFLALALAAGIFSTGRYAANAAVLREKTVALWVAHNRLTEIQLEPGWPDIGKSDGDMKLAGQKWKWQVEVQKTADDHLRRINISVLSPSRKGAAASLSAFVADTGRQ